VMSYAISKVDSISFAAPSSPITQTITVNGVSFKMVAVVGGAFNMGAQRTDATGTNYNSEAYADESPVHQVTLSSYSIGETEVTQALWYAVMGYSPTNGGAQWSNTYGLGNNYPAYYVSYTDITSFITTLNTLTGRTFRLPTEAEWEYAARGGSQSKGYKYAGSNTIGDVAWYITNSSSTAQTVKGKTANELGLYDMSGNVQEWCSDWYGSYSSSAQTNPTGAASGSSRVLHGGSWGTNADDCRVSLRDFINPDYRSYCIGFRLVLAP